MLLFLVMKKRASIMVSSRAWLIKLSLVPLLFIVFRFPGMLFRIVEAITYPEFPKLLCSQVYLCIMTLGDASQGTALFFVFVLFNEAARNHYLNWLLCKPCQQRNEASMVQVSYYISLLLSAFKCSGTEHPINFEISFHADAIWD